MSGQLCECGCGQETALATRSRKATGMVKGQPLRFIRGHGRRPRTEMLDRLIEKIDLRGSRYDCWEWTAGHMKGYGIFWTGNTMRIAHRVVYELLVAPVDPSLHLDHLCRNKNCVNPSHLEPVTPRENSRRGLSGKRQAAKTHCPQGHPYAGENLYVAPNGSRMCRICKRASERRRREQVISGYQSLRRGEAA